MTFNDPAFLFLFLPVVALLFYWPVLRGYRLAVLVAASVLFYACTGLAHLGLLLAEIVWVWALTRGASFPGSKIRLTLAAMVPVTALITFKYAGFLAHQVLPFATGPSSPVGFLDGLLLPVGISFFTFHMLAYAIDRYSGRIEVPATLAQLCFYIAFFPQMAAGPIPRWNQILPSLRTLGGFRPDDGTLRVAFGYGVAGLAYKALLADPLGRHVAALSPHPEQLSAMGAAFVTLAFNFQIYFDFYGYSLMAMGLGRLFGIDLPRNFDRPYNSANPKEFWRRWHMTLSFWIRDYLYLPLGGDRHYLRNILVIFAICGLWHGAGWNFVVWGLYHAVLVILYHSVRPAWNRMPVLMQQGITFALVAVGWLLFAFDFQGAALVLAALFGQGGGTAPVPDAGMWGLVALSALACYGTNVESFCARLPSGRWRPIMAGTGLGMVFVLAVLFVDRSAAFIYFRF